MDMLERLTNRTEDGIAYTKIPANQSNMVDAGECYTGRIIDRIAAYEDTGLTPEDVIRQLRWVHVNERLPEDGQTVLTYLQSGDIEICFYDSATYQPGWKTVTHWMPLPIPPTR